MHRQAMLQVLQAYSQSVQPLFAGGDGIDLSWENSICQRLEAFIDQHPDCFQRHHMQPGHCTGSAMVVDETFSAVVLTLHAKLQKWLQLGGHADGHPLLHEVALREAEEEAGLQELSLAMAGPGGQTCPYPLPFDLDIHPIPAHGGQPAHLHFDFRYLVIARDRTLTLSSESLALSWFPLAQARALTSEPSMQRQFDKILLLKNRIKSSPHPY